MRSWLLLLKVNLQSLLGSILGASIRKENGKLNVSKLVLYVVVAFGILTLAGMIIYLETSLYGAVAALEESMPGMSGMSMLLIGIAMLLSMIMTLIFGVFHTLGAMYFNRDTAAMAYLPVSSRTHMAAKWMEIYLIEILFSFALLLPMLICHGVTRHLGVFYYASCAVTLLSSPLYPLSICLLLSSLLGRITSLTRNKEVWVVIGTIVMLVLVIGGEWLLLPSIPEDADSMFFVNLLMKNEALLNMVVGAFPPVMWALKGMHGHWHLLALFVGVGIAAIAAVIWVMGGSYLQVCLLHTEQGTRRRKVSASGEIAVAKRSPFAAVFLREMNEVLKTPVYLLNAVLGVMMLPIMLMGVSVGAASAEESITISMLVDQVMGIVSPLDLTLIFAALFSIMSLMSPIASTAVSREGKRLPIMCMIPVAPRVILRAKLLVGLVFIAAGGVVIAAAIVILLGAEYILHVVAGLVISMLLAYAVCAGSLLCDVLRPVLNWKNETEVMKQNMNTMFGMLISMVLIAIAVAPAIVLLSQAAWIRFAAVCLTVILEAVCAVILMRKVAEPRFAALEP